MAILFVIFLAVFFLALLVIILSLASARVQPHAVGMVIRIQCLSVQTIPTSRAVLMQQIRHNTIKRDTGSHHPHHHHHDASPAYHGHTHSDTGSAHHSGGFDGGSHHSH